MNCVTFLLLQLAIVAPLERTLISTRSDKMDVVAYKMEAFMSVRIQSGSESSLPLAVGMQTEAVVASLHRIGLH